MGVAGAVAGPFGIQPLVGAFGVPYQAAEPKDERQIRLVAQIAAKCHRVTKWGTLGDPGGNDVHVRKIVY